MFASLSLVLLLAAWPFGKGGGQKGWGEGALCSRQLLSAGTLRWWEDRERHQQEQPAECGSVPGPQNRGGRRTDSARTALPGSTSRSAVSSRS
ncbi:uncharacterized protein C12orf73 homolog isoform X1 [Mustela erminea]|uniref:uncharacterized protein C12orf73 homolog isoform X1 n=1 Tax=Mustela erminea TaxID=36723 RepID=UPI001387595C|nr:uncharacterized protein C12orf73 homolog isoform X1 [Mustela erminea]